MTTTGGGAPDGAGWDWEDLRYLHAVHELGSFSAAARALGVRQSTVSRRVARLEERVGAPLFARGHDRLRPTAAAAGLARAARAMALEAEAARDELGALGPAVEGTVRIATVETLARLWLVPLLLGLRDTLPQVNFEVITGDTSVNMARREADIALRFFRPERGDLAVRRVFRERISPVVHESYLRRRGVGVEDVSLEALEWIAVDMGDLPNPEERFRAQVVGAAPVPWRVSAHGVLLELLARGAGAAMLPPPFARWMPGVVELPLPAGVEAPPLELWLVTHRSVRNHPAVGRVVEAILEHAAGGAWLGEGGG